MKSLRLLLALSALALCAGTQAWADNATDQQPPAKCDQEKKGCEKSCDKPCDKEKKDCKKDDQTCNKEKMSCCDEAAKQGKPCEKCNPPAKK